MREAEITIAYEGDPAEMQRLLEERRQFRS
jgi:hypothetical protein